MICFVFVQQKVLNTKPLSVLNKLLESKEAGKKTGNKSDVCIFQPGFMLLFRHS